jgi:Kef-type K+ transport system membrane component KefB
MFSTTEVFLLAMLIIFAVPYLVWRCGRTDTHAPLVVVQILAGVVLGPGVMGARFPGYYSQVFTAEVIPILNGIAWWGVMCFVWAAGVELDISSAWRMRRDTLTTASLALVVPMLLGALVALALQSPDWMGSHAVQWQFLGSVGMACAVTALPILVLILEKLNVLRTALGQRVLRYASLDDIAIWGVLALLLLDWQRMGRQLVFLLGFALVVGLFRLVMEKLQERDRWYASLIWLLCIGLWADWSGLHFMVGAFLAGAATDSRWFDLSRLDAFRNLVLLLLMPVFFLITGLKTVWTSESWAVPVVAAALLCAAVGGKLVGVGIAGRLLRWPRGDALTIGWLLQTKALIMIIFVSILLDKQIITGALFTALLLMAVASTMLTTPIVAKFLAKGSQDLRES